MKQELYESAAKIKRDIQNCLYEIERLKVLKTADTIIISGMGNENFRKCAPTLEFYNVCDSTNTRNIIFNKFIDELIKFESEKLIMAQKEFDDL